MAHAKVSPPPIEKGNDYVFTVAVPTESESASTTRVELTPPEGFTLDAVTPTPGWQVAVEKSGSGESAVITKITWSGGSIPPEQATNFSIVGEAESAEDYAFDVRQTYSDGTVVDWNGPESSRHARAGRRGEGLARRRRHLRHDPVALMLAAWSPSSSRSSASWGGEGRRGERELA